MCCTLFSLMKQMYEQPQQTSKSSEPNREKGFLKKDFKGLKHQIIGMRTKNVSFS
jgi:hypothetical protein